MAKIKLKSTIITAGIAGLQKNCGNQVIIYPLT